MRTGFHESWQHPLPTRIDQLALVRHAPILAHGLDTTAPQQHRPLLVGGDAMGTTSAEAIATARAALDRLWKA
jgi:hypothetical protein